MKKKKLSAYLIVVILIVLFSINVFAGTLIDDKVNPNYDHSTIPLSSSDYSNRDAYPSILSNAKADFSKIDWNLADQLRVPIERINEIPPDKVDVAKVTDKTKLTKEQLYYKNNLQKVGDLSQTKTEITNEVLKQKFNIDAPQNIYSETFIETDGTTLKKLTYAFQTVGILKLPNPLSNCTVQKMCEDYTLLINASANSKIILDFSIPNEITAELNNAVLSIIGEKLIENFTQAIEITATPLTTQAIFKIKKTPNGYIYDFAFFKMIFKIGDVAETVEGSGSVESTATTGIQKLSLKKGTIGSYSYELAKYLQIGVYSFADKNPSQDFKIEFNEGGNLQIIRTPSENSTEENIINFVENKIFLKGKIAYLRKNFLYNSNDELLVASNEVELPESRATKEFTLNYYPETQTLVMQEEQKDIPALANTLIQNINETQRKIYTSTFARFKKLSLKNNNYTTIYKGKTSETSAVFQMDNDFLFIKELSLITTPLSNLYDDIFEVFFSGIKVYERSNLKETKRSAGWATTETPAVIQKLSQKERPALIWNNSDNTLVQNTAIIHSFDDNYGENSLTASINNYQQQFSYCNNAQAPAWMTLPLLFFPFAFRKKGQTTTFAIIALAIILLGAFALLNFKTYNNIATTQPQGQLEQSIQSCATQTLTCTQYANGINEQTSINYAEQQFKTCINNLNKNAIKLEDSSKITIEPTSKGTILKGIIKASITQGSVTAYSNIATAENEIRLKEMNYLLQQLRATNPFKEPQDIAIDALETTAIKTDIFLIKNTTIYKFTDENAKQELARTVYAKHY